MEMEVDLMQGLALQSRWLLSRPGPGRARSPGAWEGLTTLLLPHLATVAVQAMTPKTTTSWSTRWPATSAGFTRESK